MNPREAKAFIEVLEKYLTIEQMRGCLDRLEQIPGDKEFRRIIQALVDANQTTMPRPRRQTPQRWFGKPGARHQMAKGYENE